LIAGTMKSQRGNGGGGIGPEETLVAETVRSHPRPGSNSNGNLIAAPLTKGSATGDGVNEPGRRQEDDINLVVAPPLVSRSSRGNAQGNSPGHNADGVIAFYSTGGSQQGFWGDDVSPALKVGSGLEIASPPAVAFAWQQGDDSKHGTDGRGRSWVTRAGDYTGALSKTRHDAVAGAAVGVRRLTPTECERLQGLPDGWTQLGDTPDSRRYSALGDAVTATVGEWIGRRLQ
jgi:site-specific DNA-cytosine methylase